MIETTQSLKNAQNKESPRLFLFLLYGGIAFATFFIAMASTRPMSGGAWFGATIALLSGWVVRRFRKELRRDEAYLAAIAIGAILGGVAAELSNNFTLPLFAGIISGFLIPYPHRLWRILEVNMIQHMGERRWQTFINLLTLVALGTVTSVAEGEFRGAPLSGLLLGFVSIVSFLLFISYFDWLYSMLGGAIIAFLTIDASILLLDAVTRQPISPTVALQLRIIMTTIGVAIGLLHYSRQQRLYTNK